MSDAAHARFYEKYGKKCSLTEPLAHMTLLGFSATVDSLICTLAGAYMICYLRLLVVDTHFPVYIPKKVLDEFPNMYISEE